MLPWAMPEEVTWPRRDLSRSRMPLYRLVPVLVYSQREIERMPAQWPLRSVPSASDSSISRKTAFGELEKLVDKYAGKRTSRGEVNVTLFKLAEKQS